MKICNESLNLDNFHIISFCIIILIGVLLDVLVQLQFLIICNLTYNFDLILVRLCLFFCNVKITKYFHFNIFSLIVQFSFVFFFHADF